MGGLHINKMKIQIPDNFMGKPIEGAMERALAQPEPPKPVVTTAPSLDGFVYVPSIKLYVAKQRELHGKDWNDCQSVLHSRGDKMLSPFEFVEFIKHLRTKDDGESKIILDEIYKVGGNWRSEWLGAKFEQGGSGLVMKYYIFDNSGIKEEAYTLKNVLMQDKKPGINLESWLADNEQGLPKSSIGNGELYYWYPRDGRVAGFDADSDWADLYCDRSPTGTDPSLGVRAVRKKI